MTWPYTPQEFAQWLVGGQGWWRFAWGGIRGRRGTRASFAGRHRDGGPFVGMVTYRYVGFGIWWRTK